MGGGGREFSGQRDDMSTPMVYPHPQGLSATLQRLRIQSEDQKGNACTYECGGEFLMATNIQINVNYINICRKL